MDPDGRPVLGLSPEDFRVEVDGKPRRVVSVEYVGRELEAPAPAPAPPRALQQQRGSGAGPARALPRGPGEHRARQRPERLRLGGPVHRDPAAGRPRGAGGRPGARADHRVHPGARRGPQGAAGRPGPGPVRSRCVPRAARRGREVPRAPRPVQLAGVHGPRVRLPDRSPAGRGVPAGARGPGGPGAGQLPGAVAPVEEGAPFGPARPEGGRGLQDGGPDLRGALDGDPGRGDPDRRGRGRGPGHALRLSPREARARGPVRAGPRPVAGGADRADHGSLRPRRDVARGGLPGDRHLRRAVRAPRPRDDRALSPRLRARGEGPRRAQPLGEGRGLAAEDERAGPDPAEHPGRGPDAPRPARERPALAAHRPDARRARGDLRDAGRRPRQGAPPDRGAGGQLPPAPERRLVPVGPGREAGDEPGARGRLGGRGRVGGVRRRGRRGPRQLPPSPRRGRCRGAAGQRRAHRQGRAGVRRRAPGLGPRARRGESGRGPPAGRRPGARGRGAAGARRGGGRRRGAPRRRRGRLRAGGLGRRARAAARPGLGLRAGRRRGARREGDPGGRPPAAGPVLRARGSLGRREGGGGGEPALPRPAAARGRGAAARPARQPPGRDPALRPGRAAEARSRSCTSSTA